MKLMNFARTLSSELSRELQCLAFSTSLPSRKNPIRCLESRAFCSSVPVRYVPKKKNNGGSENFPKNLDKNGSDKNGLKFEGSSGCGGFRGAEVVDDRSRNIERDMPVKKMMVEGNLKGFWTGEIVGEHVVSLEEDRVRNENETDLGLTDHGSRSLDYELMEEEIEELKEPESYQRDLVEVGRTKQDAEKLAVELLAMRGYTAVELRKKLHAKKISHAIIDEVINKFQSSGLINDNLYAETFSRSRWSSSTWGPRRIKQALFKKGISGGDAENAIKLVFEDGGCHGDQELSLGMSKVSMDLLIVQASKQWLRGRDVPRETRKSRIIRWLQYRGFNWNVISFVIKKLEAQLSP